jgi:acyl carrier protein
MTSRADTQITIESMMTQLLACGSLDVDADIFESGAVNSLLALQIINRLERLFKFEVDEEDLDRDNFASVTKMTDFVLRKRVQSCPDQR